MPFSALSLYSPQSTFLLSRNSIVPKEALQSRIAVHKLSRQLLLLFTLLEIPPNAPGKWRMKSSLLSKTKLLHHQTPEFPSASFSTPEAWLSPHNTWCPKVPSKARIPFSQHWNRSLPSSWHSLGPGFPIISQRTCLTLHLSLSCLLVL